MQGSCLLVSLRSISISLEVYEIFASIKVIGSIFNTFSNYLCKHFGKVNSLKLLLPAPCYASPYLNKLIKEKNV